MTDVRAITPNCSGLRRPNCEIISSVRPSARYSLLGSPVRFATQYGEPVLCDPAGATSPKVSPKTCTDNDQNHSTRAMMAAFSPRFWCSWFQLTYLAFDPGQRFRLAVRVSPERPSDSVAIRLVRSAGIRAPSEFQCTWDDRHRLRAPFGGSPLHVNASIKFTTVSSGQRICPYFLAGDNVDLALHQDSQNLGGLPDAADFCGPSFHGRCPDGDKFTGSGR